MMSDISLLYSGAVSPLVVPRTTDSVILAGRESRPLLFPHKVTEVSPRGPGWGGRQAGHSLQLWRGEGQFTWGDGRARGRGCWSGHLAAHRNAPTSEALGGGRGAFQPGSRRLHEGGGLGWVPLSIGPGEEEEDTSSPAHSQVLVNLPRKPAASRSWEAIHPVRQSSTPPAGTLARTLPHSTLRPVSLSSLFRQHI